MKKFFLLLPLFIYAEVNPFNIKIDKASYDALTPQEKQILKNRLDIKYLKKQIQTLFDELDKYKLKLLNYDNVIESLNQKTSAFETILSEIDSIRGKLLNLKKDNNITKMEIEKINQKIALLENNITDIQNNISAIKDTIKEITKVQNQNFIYLKQSIDTILKTIKNQNKKLSPKEAINKAKKLFYSGKLDEAKEYFLYTLSKKYLPATSSYYLGEIAFKQGNYQEALGYYKKSVELYPKKTSFTSRLLYHTAISFKKLGNKKAAELTFKKLIRDFPNSKYSELAKKELEKLK